MTSAESDFRNWFVNSLRDLRDNGNAGFVFAFTAFPLLERYLRNKSDCPEGYPLTDKFFKNLGQIIKEVSGREHEFWNCYKDASIAPGYFPKSEADSENGYLG